MRQLLTASGSAHLAPVRPSLAAHEGRHTKKRGEGEVPQRHGDIGVGDCERIVFKERLPEPFYICGFPAPSILIRPPDIAAQYELIELVWVAWEGWGGAAAGRPPGSPQAHPQEPLLKVTNRHQLWSYTQLKRTAVVINDSIIIIKDAACCLKFKLSIKKVQIKLNLREVSELTTKIFYRIRRSTS